MTSTDSLSEAGVRGYSYVMHSVSSAARLCGVSPSTLRAWERRYGVVEPIRTEGGYRVYDDAALRRLTRMSSLIASGWSPRHAAAYVMNEDGEGDGALPLGGQTEEEVPDPIPPTTAEVKEHIEVILQAAERLDAPRVSDELDFAFSVHSFDDLVDLWLGPVLKATGDAWAEGRLSVAGEHFLSVGIERRIAKYYEEADQQARGAGPSIVVGTPRGARHSIGSFAFATSLRRHGCDVTYLGADVPPEAWLEAIEACGAWAVGISVPTEDDAVAASETIALITKAHPDLTVYYGGSGSGSVTAKGATRLDGKITTTSEQVRKDLEAVVQAIADQESSTAAV